MKMLSVRVVLLTLLVVCAACQARIDAGPYLVMDSKGARYEGAGKEQVARP